MFQYFWLHRYTAMQAATDRTTTCRLNRNSSAPK